MEALTQEPHLLVPVAEPEDVGAARRAVARRAAEGGGAATLIAQAELVVTELAGNLLRHAHSGGYVLARTLRSRQGTGVELLAVDRGPGMRDVEAALLGAGSSTGGLGCGLAGVRRLATAFDVHSAPDAGTVVMARLLPAGAAARPRWSGVCVALDGYMECGDAWAITEHPGTTTVLVVDGLGHGPDAALAAQAAVLAFDDAGGDDMETMVRRIHEAMRSTRGGAAAVCRLEPQARRAQFVGVGNVLGRLLDNGRSQAMVSLSGTLGAELAAPRIHCMSYELGRDAVLVMSSDGLRDGFDASALPGLLTHDPAVIAAVIHRERTRGTDDATVVVVHPPPQQEPAR